MNSKIKPKPCGPSFQRYLVRIIVIVIASWLMLLLLTGCGSTSTKSLDLPEKTVFVKQCPAIVLYQPTIPHLFRGMTREELIGSFILALDQANADKAQIQAFCEAE